MHGVKRFHLSEEGRRQKLEKEATKIKNYKLLTESVLTKNQNKKYDDLGFRQTTDILNVNPEFYTVWNFRRDIITNHYMKTMSSEELVNLFNDELVFNMLKFKAFPKVYWIWNHRVWVLENHPKVDWMAEMGLVKKILAADSRNFHGWTYRRFIVSKIEESQGRSLALEEFEFTTEKINNNFSNFSAWHNRTKLIPKLFQEVPTPEFESHLLFVKKELGYLKNAMYTDPEDQSPFIYLRWLLTDDLFVRSIPQDEYLSILHSELANLKELNELEKDDNGKDNNWCLKTIVTIDKIIADVTKSEQDPEIRECLVKLMEADPLRKKRYADLQSSR